jgi:hypothetical protein
MWSAIGARDLPEMIRVMEKNYFAALDYRLEVVLAGGTMVILMLFVLLLGLVSGTPLGLSQRSRRLA